MPTGYTHKIHEGTGETFAEFAWHCARNFGAMFHLREENNEVPTLAQALMNDSGEAYHVAELQEAEAHLSAVLRMSPADMDAQRVADEEKRLAEWARAVTNKNAIKQRYQDMLDKVKAWIPPTSEHDGLRDFMIQQIEESMRWDCYDPEPPTSYNLDAYRAAMVERATWGVNYHAKELARCREAEAKRRAWVEALHASIPNPRG